MKAYEIVSTVLKLLAEYAKPGWTTGELDEMAYEKVIELGGIPYNLGYKPDWATSPFPATICTCINDEIAHGIPSPTRVLKEGDLISIDIGVKKDGLSGDGALTVGVGEISDRDKRLLWNAKKVLYAGISKVKAGVEISEITQEMVKVATQNNFVLNRIMCGHGIGAEMHEEPKIPHFFFPDMELGVLQAGQMICLEPMLTYTDHFGVLDKDGWTFKTRDGKKSSFFEHQIKVLDDGFEILTNHFDKENN